MTSSWFLRQGSLHAILHNGFWKSDYDFLIAFHSILFWDAWFPRQRGIIASRIGHYRDFSARGRFTLFYITDSEMTTPTFYSCSIDFFVYLERFRRYSTFNIWLGFPYWGEILGVSGQNDPQDVNWEKTLAGMALPYAKLRLLSYYAWNYLYPFGLCRCARYKKAGRMEKSQEVYISRMCGATRSSRIPTKLSTCVCLPDIITHAAFHWYSLKGFGAVRW